MQAKVMFDLLHIPLYLNDESYRYIYLNSLYILVFFTLLFYLSKQMHILESV